MPTLPIQITCPKCGAKYTAQVQSVVDVGRDPMLKSLLLRGGLNTVTCPSCGTPGRVSAPLLYHDPQKELLVLFIPPELNLPMPEREKLAGSLVNALMSMVPAEQRKGYFLNPRTMLTMQGLIDEILKADGITKEMLDEQRARGQLLQDLLRAIGDEQKLNGLIEENKGTIDYPFFLTLSAAAESSAVSGQKQLAERLLQLRDALLARVQIELPEPLPPDTPPATIIDKLRAAKDEETRWALVLYNRPLLDYGFFQELTARIAKAPPEEAENLRKLRTEVLEMVEQLDKESIAAQQEKLKLLQDLMASPDPARTLNERKLEIDTLFLAVLGASLRGAEKDGDAKTVERLKAINKAVLELLQESMPPGLRLVNDLLAAEYPQGTETILQERRTELQPDFLEMVDALVQDLEEQQRPQVAQRLKDIRSQAAAILQQPARA